MTHQMQYFQKANSKQMVGHVATAANCDVDEAAWVAGSAGAAVRRTSAMATTSSSLFMTVSFEGQPLAAFCWPSTWHMRKTPGNPDTGA